MLESPATPFSFTMHIGFEITFHLEFTVSFLEVYQDISWAKSHEQNASCNYQNVPVFW